MIFLYIGLGILGLLIILYIVLIIVHHMVFYTPLKWQNDDYLLTGPTLKYASKESIVKMIDDLKAVSYEEVSILSGDKKKLYARQYVNKNSKKVAIMMHGYRGTACRDFSGGAKSLIDLGLNVILADERGHGKSEGHSITFGRKEKLDCLKWVEYAKKTFGEDIEIILVGISMGAATVIYASEYLENVKVIADCPYNTPKEVILEVMRKNKMPAKLLYPLVFLSSLVVSRINLAKENGVKSVKNANNKILILHGEEDTLVPYKFSYKIYEENPDKVKYVLFPETEHGVAFITDTPRYKKEVENFILNS